MPFLERLDLFECKNTLDPNLFFMGNQSQTIRRIRDAEGYLYLFTGTKSSFFNVSPEGSSWCYRFSMDTEFIGRLDKPAFVADNFTFSTVAVADGCVSQSRPAMKKLLNFVVGNQPSGARVQMGVIGIDEQIYNTAMVGAMLRQMSVSFSPPVKNVPLISAQMNVPMALSSATITIREGQHSICSFMAHSLNSGLMCQINPKSNIPVPYILSFIITCLKLLTMR